MIDEVLDEAGYMVINAVNGASSINVMNGRQVADAARAIRPGLKVLFITGYAENAAVGNGHLEPGMQLLTNFHGRACRQGR